MAEIDWVILCDYAFLDVGRKPCAIGIFDRIFALAVPATHHQASIAIRLTGNPAEDVKFKIEIMRPIASGQGAIAAFSGEAKLGDRGSAEVVTNIAGLPLPDYGDYAFNIYLDDKLAKVLTFAVVRPPGAGGDGGPASPAR